MKKLILMSALVIGGLGIKTANAQFGIRINLHLGTHPVYVPAPEPVVVDDQPYDNDDDYFYLPEVEAYYSIVHHAYYYQDGDRWISAAYLPGRYHDFDWRAAKHYEVRAPRPYLHHDVYRSRYGGLPNRAAFYAEANRGGFDRRNDRGFEPNRDGGFNNHNRDGYERRDDRGPVENNRGWFDRRNDRSPADNNRGGFDRNQGGYNQPQQNRGDVNQQGQNQGNYNQGGQGRNQGYNQGSQSQGGSNQNSQQPTQGQGQQGGRGGQGNGNSQPANHSNGQGNGNYNGGDHFAANKIGVINDRGQFARPVRN